MFEHENAVLFYSDFRTWQSLLQYSKAFTSITFK